MSLYTKGIVLAGNFTQLKKLLCFLKTEKKSSLKITSGEVGTKASLLAVKKDRQEEKICMPRMRSY